MADSLPVPYKSRYPLGDFWAELTKGSLWATYAKANPNESAALEQHAKRKIAQEADMIPKDLTHTFTGNAILMAILTLPA